MRLDEEQQRLTGNGLRSGFPGRGLLHGLLRIAVGALLLALALAFSLVLFVVLVAGGLVLWAFLWWQTRKLRQQTYAPPFEQTPAGLVIEGEVIRETRKDIPGEH